MLTPEQITLICDYLGAAKGLDELRSTQADFDRANALALRCMATLPSKEWSDVIKAVVSPTPQAAIDIALAMRDAGDPLDKATQVVWHAPGIGKKS